MTRIMQDFLRRTASEVLHDKRFDGYQRGLASMVYIFLIRNRLVLILQMVLLKVKFCQIKN